MTKKNKDKDIEIRKLKDEIKTSDSIIFMFLCISGMFICLFIITVMFLELGSSCIENDALDEVCQNITGVNSTHVDNFLYDEKFICKIENNTVEDNKTLIEII